ncbi:MAG: hypothetical protein RQ866_03195 [Bacteroidales bacterium]|nr:hypothetical protein [Bacteroidales bacterium]
MKKNSINLKFILISVFAVAVFFSTKAQEAVLTAGGDIASPHGSVSYSIGQVIQTMDTATTGSVAHGVQQPYEISEITGIQQIIKIPLFTTSVAHGITQSDTIRWNQKSDFDGQYTSLTGSPVNVSYFNNDAGYLTVENDDSDTNELQQLSMHNDTISLNLGGGYVVLPKGDQPGDMRYWNGTM